MKENETAVIAEALEKLTARLDDAVGKRSRRDEESDSPMGVDTLRGRREDPLEIRAVLFPVKIPVGRRGETVPAYLQFDGVGNQDQLERLAEMVRREFPDLTIYQPKREFGGNGYGRGGYDRDRNGRW